GCTSLGPGSRRMLIRGIRHGRSFRWHLLNGRSTVARNWGAYARLSRYVPVAIDNGEAMESNAFCGSAREFALAVNRNCPAGRSDRMAASRHSGAVAPAM